MSDISEGRNMVTHEAGSTAAKRPSRTLANLTANRVCILEFSLAFAFFFFGGGGGAISRFLMYPF